MRKISLIIGIIGLGILISFLVIEPIEVDDLSGIIVGEVVSISGIVREEREWGEGKLLTINEIPIYCECEETYMGENVEVRGIIENFPENLRIRVFEIEKIK